ncbi:16S rRNA (cytosine(967)-C(5))-methyltransferase RsmB [Ferrimonas lipolytica]|uniref:16S rRNA (cytosine(967)-C(5))-methyltransferase n=1 Tax=Ferrimonas lipolytica TaxID=2724191 RepID=A0A6H1UH98_9GAMM|nr:16S rRNA (cytosine(967)-C(5))-methyltransferase RsmB [Ferrimonas lipolytica]QIZ78198.1 16S rRNA (cytosine(967)-C(5))-methyltransferase RsmB [Ferrimonas lipolytica]
MSNSNLRADAARVILAVIDQGQSMGQALPRAQRHYVDGRDKGLLAEICYGVMRTLPQLDTQLRRQLEKPLSGKKRIIHCVLLAGLYQLKHTRVASHAVISETVEACRELRAPGMTGLVNGVLRSLQRNIDQLMDEQFEAETVQTLHPSWLLKRLQAAYPQQWQQVVEANNQQPPLWLRNNISSQSRSDYLEELEEEGIDAVVGDSDDAFRLLQATDVTKLPGFKIGAVSVQDLSAQRSAQLLDCQAGDEVLDVCAAPGGKTCHMLERQPKIAKMVAVDLSKERLKRVQQNLDRIGLDAELRDGDARYPVQWAPGQQFDRILLDAPCSATGVIRRNPDSKWLRRDADIAQLAEVQREILDAMWAILKPGGTLLYATCSVLPEENAEQIKAFLNKTGDAMLSPIQPQESAEQPGWQLLPQQDGGDGFYYARLIKKA